MTQYLEYYYYTCLKTQSTSEVSEVVPDPCVPDRTPLPPSWRAGIALWPAHPHHVTEAAPLSPPPCPPVPHQA